MFRGLAGAWTGPSRQLWLRSVHVALGCECDTVTVAGPAGLGLSGGGGPAPFAGIDNSIREATEPDTPRPPSADERIPQGTRWSVRPSGQV
eukprot:scaffold912_cov422-Prasinococcus_capsulatus_cf.AAC.4